MVGFLQLVNLVMVQVQHHHSDLQLLKKFPQEQYRKLIDLLLPCDQMASSFSEASNAWILQEYLHLQLQTYLKVLLFLTILLLMFS